MNKMLLTLCCISPFLLNDIMHSVASPNVGNVKFLLAFQALERMKRLQHLRIANAEDVVTHLPFIAPKVSRDKSVYMREISNVLSREIKY